MPRVALRLYENVDGGSGEELESLCCVISQALPARALEWLPLKLSGRRYSALLKNVRVLNNCL